MKLYNPKHGCVLQACLLMSAPLGSLVPGGVAVVEKGGWGAGSSAVELSCVAPCCVSVLACDMVRGAQCRDLAAC